MAALRGVTELAITARGKALTGFVFDHHRQALGCWAQLAQDGPLLLVTVDRHFDTVPPKVPPPEGASPEELERYAHERLDPRNVDHLLAAMDAGVLTHAVLVARAPLPGAITGPVWLDRRGGEHQLVSAPTIDALSAGWGTARVSPAGASAGALLARASGVVLDVDLDAFTTPSDADPTTIIPWPVEHVRAHLAPRGSERLWDAIRARLVGLTIAREPLHCGGVVASGRLLEALAQVLFIEILGADVP